MIRYALACSKGHVYEEWFDNMADYDLKAEKKQLKCPECGDKKVKKSIMAPNVAKKAQPQPTCGASACANMGCPMSGA